MLIGLSFFLQINSSFSVSFWFLCLFLANWPVILELDRVTRNRQLFSRSHFFIPLLFQTSADD